MPVHCKTVHRDGRWVFATATPFDFSFKFLLRLWYNIWRSSKAHFHRAWVNSKNHEKTKKSALPLLFPLNDALCRLLFKSHLFSKGLFGQFSTCHQFPWRDWRWNGCIDRQTARHICTLRAYSRDRINITRIHLDGDSIIVNQVNTKSVTWKGSWLQPMQGRISPFPVLNLL